MASRWMMDLMETDFAGAAFYTIGMRDDSLRSFSWLTDSGAELVDWNAWMIKVVVL
jgi:hypothetical protein